MTVSSPSVRATTSGALLVAAIVLVALNLRGPLVAVSPVLDTMRTDLGMSAAVAGLLTSLPVLCFAVAAPPASWLLGRLGLERAVLAALGVLAAGTLLRSVGGTATALAGTVAIGIGITVGNVAIPVVVGRDFPHRSGALLGAYTAALNVGSMITLSLTVPLADGAGIGWRWALATWVVLVAAAALVWAAASRARTAAAETAGALASGARGADDPGRAEDGSAAAAPPSGPVWWRRPVVWALTLAFGGQAFAYYGLTAWLPELLADLRGLDPAAAGLSSSIFQITAIVGAIVVPVVRARANSLRAAFTLVVLAWLALPVGLLVAPAWWPLWCGLGGAAQGGGFTAIFSAVLARAGDLVENRRISAFVQGGGYAVAAAGPSVVGAVHDLSVGWTVPLLVVLTSLSVLAVAGLGATRRIRTTVAPA